MDLLLLGLWLHPPRDPYSNLPNSNSVVKHYNYTIKEFPTKNEMLVFASSFLCVNLL